MLAFFLGGTGAHRYYLGYKDEGGLQTCGFVMTIMGSFAASSALQKGYINLLQGTAENEGGGIIIAAILLLVGAASGIWVFVDFIRILTGSLVPRDGTGYTENRPVQIVYQLANPESQRSVSVQNDVSCPFCGTKNNPSRQVCLLCNSPLNGSVPTKSSEPITTVQPTTIPVETVAKSEETSKNEGILHNKLDAVAYSDFFELLEKLAKLHEQGILNDEEFQQKKTDILAKM